LAAGFKPEIDEDGGNHYDSYRAKDGGGPLATGTNPGILRGLEEPTLGRCQRPWMSTGPAFGLS
jgi:hypothetical protein